MKPHPFLVLAVVLLGAAPARAADAALDVYFHADLDGQLSVPTCGKPSAAPPDYAALLGALTRARAEGADARPSLALLGPNTIAPDLYARQLFSDDPTRAAASLAALFRPAGYAAFAIGSRDLSAEPAWSAAFIEAMGKAGVPLVLSNVSCSGAASVARAAVCRAARPRLLLDVPGVGKVGVAATLSPRLAGGIEASRREGLAFADPLATLTREIAALRSEGAARVLVLTEVPGDGAGLDELRVLQTALGDLPSPPDAVFSSGLADADGARPVRFLSLDHGPAVVGSTSGARSVARLSLSADAPQASRVAADPASPDATAAATLAPWSRLYCERYGQPLGPVARQPLGREAFVGYVLEVMRRSAGAEVAVVNAKLVKAAPFPISGAITAGELVRAIPYRAVLGTARVLGAQLGATLGTALGNPRLRVVGLTNEGGLKVNGRPIDNARRYTIATIAFVAQGGDGIFAPGALAWRPLEGEPDVERLVRDFLVREAGAHDGDPTIDPATDFGPPPGERPLIVGVTDLGFDLLDTSIANGPQYTDAQLTRARQTSVKGDWTSLVQLRAPSVEVDARLRLQYGWARTMPAGKPAVSAETVDLITGSVTYNDRKLRHVLSRAPGPTVPDPYGRLMFESEFTRPPVTLTQPRDYHHAELTATAGMLFTPFPKLRVRGGPGVRKELVAPGAPGRWRSVVEAGVTLDQIVLASLGALAVRFDGAFDYVLVEPAGQHQQQIRSTAHLSVPLLPTLFVSVGVDVYAAQYSPNAWAASADTTVGLRVHLDRARQTY
jgi:2',3'-cyclic-nucleotide 2'-phosphodiesterase (5'-nucleotidase family)